MKNITVILPHTVVHLANLNLTTMLYRMFGNVHRQAEERHRVRRQAFGRRFPAREIRIRREYRLLTDTQRRLFHRSMNMLKADMVSQLVCFFHTQFKLCNMNMLQRTFNQTSSTNVFHVKRALVCKLTKLK